MRCTKAVWLVAFGFLAFWPIAINAQTDPQLPTLSSHHDIYGLVIEPPFLQSEMRWSLPKDFSHTAQWIRVSLKLITPSHSDWRLLIKDKFGNVCDVLNADSFSTGPAQNEVITNMIDGGSVSFELLADENPGPLKIEISGYNEQAPPVSIKAIIDGPGHDHRQDLVEAYGRSSDFYKWGKPVAAVFFPKPESPHDETNCTIFLLTESLAITNGHCITQAWQVPKSRVLFGLESMPVDKLEVSLLEVITPDPNSSLDFELLRLAKAAKDWGTVTLGAEPHEKQQFILIQQPDGGVKKIARNNCKLDKKGSDSQQPEFFHLCDSSGGSSGSPVMDLTTGNVVGIHHIGVYGSTSKDVRNLAVKASYVIKAIKDYRPDIYSEIAKVQPNLR